MVWTGKAQWVLPTCKVWNLSHLRCLSKSQCWNFRQVKKLDQRKTWKLSPLNTDQSHTNHIVHNFFKVCSSHKMFKLQRPRIQNMQFAVYISDTPVTLKQSQGHQTYNDNVHPKQGYNHAKLEKSCFRGVWEKAHIKVCFKWWKIPNISLKYLWK